MQCIESSRRSAPHAAKSPIPRYSKAPHRSQHRLVVDLSQSKGGASPCPPLCSYHAELAGGIPAKLARTRTCSVGITTLIRPMLASEEWTRSKSQYNAAITPPATGPNWWKPLANVAQSSERVPSRLAMVANATINISSKTRSKRCLTLFSISLNVFAELLSLPFTGRCGSVQAPPPYQRRYSAYVGGVLEPSALSTRFEKVGYCLDLLRLSCI